MSSNVQRIAPSQTINIKYNTLDSNATRFINPNGFTTHDALIKYNSKTAQFEQSSLLEGDLSSLSMRNLPDKQILFGDGSYIEAQSSNLVWDYNNNRLGINTTTPTHSLTVFGDASKNSGTSWITTSDIKTKKDIKPYEKGLETVNQINPVSFQYNGEYDTPLNGKTQIGIIANDLKDILPECVDMDEKHNIYRYDGNAMDFLLINAVKQLSQQNTILQNQLNELKEEVSELKELSKIKN